MKRILLAIPLAFLAGIAACSPQPKETAAKPPNETGKPPGDVDCHVVVINSKDTAWVKATNGDTLWSTIAARLASDTIHHPRPPVPPRADSAISMDTVHHPKAPVPPRPDLSTVCLQADTVHRP